MRAVLDRGFGLWMDNKFGIDTDGWDVARIGSQFWIVDEDLRPVILLSKSGEAAALATLRGLVHGMHLEDTLVKSGVLQRGWRNLL